MFSIKTNPIHNRLYITLKGKMDVEEIQLAANDILLNAQKLKSGFNIISDTSSFIPLSEEGRVIMENAMNQVKELGLNKEIQIISQQAQSLFNQRQYTSRSTGYAPKRALTLPEAEALLNRLEKDR
jgi:hypothetical protein